MPNGNNRFDGHERFRELGALANSGTLSANEWLELKHHLRVCQDCREIHNQYQLLNDVGMPFLAAAYGDPQELEHSDDSFVREKLLYRIAEAEAPPSDALAIPAHRATPPHLLSNLAANQWMRVGLATCLGIAVALGAYNLGSRTHNSHNSKDQKSSSSQQQAQKLTAEKQSNDQPIASAARISRIQEQNARQEQEIGRLRTNLRALEDRSRELGAADHKTKEELREVIEQRERLTLQLQQAEQLSDSMKAELVSLRAERDRGLLHTASLESKINDLAVANREQEQKVGEDERFLASDRDIRELMGARKLYIADVFDVDSGSRTRKPFGRIFYTQNKSLIFYAFDLDHQAGVKAASIFQVWGQKDAEQGEKPRAMNLGILYMDSESNRRWVLRLDDPKEIAAIDAVFVTVEPHVGSPKPTGKPFLYALLRKEANHP
jgi:hypothetical protein